MNYIRMISEGLCDTEGVMMQKIQLCITQISYILKCMIWMYEIENHYLKCNNIS